MSDKIELKAYGKINLGLDVIRKRPDGYHDLDMIMQTVNVYDDIIITKTEKKGEIKVTTDKEVLSNEKGNLAYMAARMLFDEFGINDGIEIRINKRIPIAGGMAGRAINKKIDSKTVDKLFIGLMVVLIFINIYNIYRFVG